MNFTIIASEKDSAGKNIFRHIHEDYPSLKHYLIQEDSIHAENIDKKIKGDFFIFATKHKSEQERKTFSVHAPGNWGSQKSVISDDYQNSERILKKAELGGREGKICPTSALFLKHLFITLSKEVKNTNSGYECTLEVTHHGPYLEKPCCFIEIGSGEEQWKDEKAGKIIAETIKKAIESFKQAENQKFIPAIGIGSKHYCPNFNKIQLNSEYALGHIIPQYAFPITEEMLKQAIEKTQEKVELAILDWKGLSGEERRETIKLLNKLNLKYKKTNEIEK